MFFAERKDLFGIRNFGVMKKRNDFHTSYYKFSESEMCISATKSQRHQISPNVKH